MSHPATAAAPHLVHLGDLHGADLDAAVVVRIKVAAARFDVPAAAIARRALAAGLPAVFRELEARAAWDPDRAPSAREPLERP